MAAGPRAVPHGGGAAARVCRTIPCRPAGRDVGAGPGDQVEYVAIGRRPHSRRRWAGRASRPARTAGRCNNRCRRRCASRPCGSAFRSRSAPTKDRPPLVSAHVQASGRGKAGSGRKTELGAGWSGSAVLVSRTMWTCAIDFVVPGAAVPVVVADEVEDAGTFDVERDVAVVGELIEEVGGVGALVAAGAVVGAAHVGARADALVGPVVPHAISVETDGDGRLRLPITYPGKNQ